MGKLEAYTYLTPISNEWLRRYQVPTDRVIDRTSLELIKIFVNTIDPNMERLPGLGNEPLDEANKFLTVELKNIGVNLGRHPSREIRRAEDILKLIKGNPYVTYTTQKGGKKVYHEMPLIKKFDISEDGQCKLVFNDSLRYFFFPEKDYALCSLDLFKEIRTSNICAAIIYEEACSYEYMFKLGKTPSFAWSVKDARKKLFFDKMTDFSTDGTEFITISIKTMRPADIRSRIFYPAIAELKKFFNEGKTNFWLELNEPTGKKDGPGRPPKDYFRFILRKDKKNIQNLTSAEGQQLDIPFGECEVINNLYNINTELKGYIISKNLIAKIVKQIELGEAKGSETDILQKIKNIKSHKNNKGKNKYEIGSKILAALGIDYGLGDLSKIKKAEGNDDQNNVWPDTLEGRIQKMMESMEIKDRASDEFNLSSEEVDNILKGPFFETCFKNNKHIDPGENWRNIVDHFFAWLKRMNIYGPLNLASNGNSENKRDFQGREFCYTQSENAADKAYDYFVRRESKGNI